MAALLLALVLALLLEQGSSAQRRIAETEPPKRARLMIGIALASTGVAAFAGGALAPLLPSDARLLFLALALGFSAIGLLMAGARLSGKRHDRRSVWGGLAAFAAARVADNVLFAVLAVGAFTAAPLLAATGGMTGSLFALSVAMVGGPALKRSSLLRVVQLLGGTLLLLGGIFAAAHALRLSV